MNDRCRILRLVAAVLTLLLAPALVFAGEGQIRRNVSAVPGEYIVVLNDDIARRDTPGMAGQLVSQYGGSLQKTWQDALKGFFIRMTEGQAQALSHDRNVKFIEENAAISLSSVPTNVDPACTPPSTCPTPDNRLWHLDVLDQNDAIPTHQYASCSTGAGTYVYEIDTGILRAHREFGNSASRVVDGFNSAGDGSFYPAFDPCHGPPTPDEYQQQTAIFLNGHGTGVGSVVAGNNVGVAPGAVLVPVKVTRCGEFAAKVRNDTKNTSTQMAVGQFAYHNSFYKCIQAGQTAPPNATINWSITIGDQVQDGTVVWQCIGSDGYFHAETEQMLIDGVNWILGPNNPYPRSPAVVTLSTYQIAGTSLSAFEEAILTLISNGLTVVASANNQDANACDTTPARLSRNDPNPTFRGNVITAGGTMTRNRPDVNPNATADGGLPVSLLDPAYDRTKPTLPARWRCYAGDSDVCSGNIYSVPPPVVPNPATDPNGYSLFNLGSNGGACVTLFAPARNIPVATNAPDASGNPTLYRDVTVRGGLASGTSWSAPYVAGVAARILQGNPSLPPDGVYAALMSHATPDLDPTELDPPNVTGTPNALLHLPDVTIAPLPLANSGPVTASATGTGALTYQWYQVNSDYAVAGHPFGAAASTPLAGQTSATLSNPANAVSYFVRVTSSCGSADSNITTFGCQPAGITSQAVANPASIVSGSSSTLSVGASGSSPVVQWFNAAGVSVATGASITVSPTTTTTYYATVANACTQPVRSDNVTVSVCQPPAFTSLPNATPNAIPSGGSAMLSIGVTGPSPVVQWFTSAGVFAGTGASISVSPTADTVYHATLSNGCGPTLTSGNVSVTICVLPTVTTAPTANRTTITSGQSATLQATGGTGVEPLTFEWYTSANVLVATGKKINVSPTVTTTYYYKISNICGRSAASSTITITVQ